jgi:eukaryotic-like serine/threonine-protein kinase
VMRPDRLLEEVADAILEPRPIDWAEIESRSQQTEKPILEQLKTLANLRHAGRSAESADRPEPWHWGHLRVLECVGRGAFGEVYRAWDTRLDREVALKLLPPESASADSRASSIIEEGRLLARARHPNVVTIYGAERIAGRTGLWMEFVEGRTLEEILRGGKQFTAKEVTSIGVELCQAVSAVHAEALLHRDIKAHNVMAADNGRLVLMDFGTGRELDRVSETDTSGTPLYLSPEVLSGAAATVRSDVYSIGVLLFHLLTGSYPVQARDLADLRRAHAQGERRALRSARVDVPPRLARVIERAIDPNPEQRYASADSLRAALAAVQAVPSFFRTMYAAAAVLALIAAASIIWGLGARGLSGSAPATAPLATGAVWGSETPVIAVLPFKNLSSEADSEYFVDGLTEDIIRNLAVIDGLQVRSQTSSFLFKNQPRNLRDIGERLRANLIVEGSVQREGKRLRIAAQLVPVAGDVPLWSERYDRRLEEVFAIQDEISRAIVNKLRLTLGRGQRRYQPPVDAYELYLRARALLRRRGIENARSASRTDAGEKATSLFEQVIAKDPSFAPAYAGLADAYALMSWEIPGLPFEEGLMRMRPAALKALELDPLLAEAHAAMGITYSRERDWKNAEESFDRALELNPSITQIHTNYCSSTLLPLGKSRKALQLLEAALTTDPLSLDVRRELAMAQIIVGRYDDAIANLRRVLAVDPEFPSARLQLTRALTFSGRPAEAVAFWKSRPESQGDWQRWLAHAYVRCGRRADAERLLELRKNEHPYRQALVYAALGDKDRTFEALNRAADILPQRTVLVLVYPEMALLRGDPRLDALRRKFKLP